MSSEILRDSLQQLEKLVNEYREALDGIPDDDLNTWKPAAERSGGGEMNTFAAICYHAGQAASWRIVHQIFEQAYPRDRDSEFSATASRAEIDEMFETLLSRFTDFIESQPSVDLSVLPPTIRRDSPDWTKMAYLVNTIGHTALHLGHVQIHKQLWLAERGPDGTRDG